MLFPVLHQFQSTTEQWHWSINPLPNSFTINFIWGIRIWWQQWWKLVQWYPWRQCYGSSDHSIKQSVVVCPSDSSDHFSFLYGKWLFCQALQNDMAINAKHMHDGVTYNGQLDPQFKNECKWVVCNFNQYMLQVPVTTKPTASPNIAPWVLKSNIESRNLLILVKYNYCNNKKGDADQLDLKHQVEKTTRDYLGIWCP